MRTLLILIFLGVFAAMTCVTIVATLERGIFEAGRELWADAWFRATLMDAYCGFVTCFVWVAYKEACWRTRITWFVLIMLLGNFAMSAYVLRQLFKVKPFSWQGLLLRETAAS